MRFLIDTKLPVALAHWLHNMGHHAEHVLDLDLAKGKDTPIWLYALENGAVIITKDEDFAEWVRRGRPGPRVVWLRIGNSSKRTLLMWIEPLLPLILGKLEQNERLIEAR